MLGLKFVPVYHFIIQSRPIDQSWDWGSLWVCDDAQECFDFPDQKHSKPSKWPSSPKFDTQETLTWAHWTIWGRSNSSRKASNCCLAPSLDNSWSNPPVIHTQSQFLLNSNEMNVLRQKLVLDTEQMKMYCSVYTVFPFARESNFSAEWKFW